MLYISEDFDCTIAEGSLSISIWIMISVVGNAMLFGIVQNSRLQGDPLKQRITDQVSKWHYLIIRNGILRGLFIVDHLSWSPDYISEFYSSYYSAVGIYQAIRLEFQNKHFWRCCETFLYWLSSHASARIFHFEVPYWICLEKGSHDWSWIYCSVVKHHEHYYGNHFYLCWGIPFHWSWYLRSWQDSWQKSVRQTYGNL